MYYISEETYQDTSTRRKRKGPAKHIIVVLDTASKDFKIECPWKDLPEQFERFGVDWRNVVGLYRAGRQTMYVTPLNVAEVAVLHQITGVEEYILEHKDGGSYDFLPSCGLYNFSYLDDDKASIARLLLDYCKMGPGTIGDWISVDKNSISIAVSHTCATVSYVRYNLTSYDIFRRIQSKAALFGMSKKYHQSFHIKWEDFVEVRRVNPLGMILIGNR